MNSIIKELKTVYFDLHKNFDNNLKDCVRCIFASLKESNYEIKKNVFLFYFKSSSHSRENLSLEF